MSSEFSSGLLPLTPTRLLPSNRVSIREARTASRAQGGAGPRVIPPNTSMQQTALRAAAHAERWEP